MCTLNILIHILLISGSFAPGTSFVNAIHAPANGATEDQHQATEVHPISINALTNGATAIKNLQMTLSTNFNPRSGERSDLQLIKEYREFNISIHAPANGATLINMTVSRSGTFQSMLRRTERLIQAGESGLTIKISIHAPANGATHNHDHSNQLKIFQSTLRRTERHYAGSA